MNMHQPLRYSLWERWRSIQQKRLIKRTTLTTYAGWAKRYPEWVVGFFDEHFVLSQVVPLVYHFSHSQRPVDPRCLVEAWADQLHFTPTQRQLRMQSLLPAAVDFLARFKAELTCLESDNPDWLGPWLQSEWSIPQLQVKPLCQS